MKKLLILKSLFVLFPGILPAQVEIYVHQSCQQRVIGVINHPEITGEPVDDQTMKFIIPKAEEPTRISFYIDTAGFKTERVWVDTSSKRIDLLVYNCKSYQSRVEQPNLLTKEERTNNLYFDYLAQKYEDRQAYTKAFNDFVIAYIKEHPTSFLSLNYASKITPTDAELAEILQILEPANGKYPTFQKMKNRLLYKGKVKMGEPLPMFEAVDLQGKSFSTQDLHSKVTLLMFWHSGCSWSKKVIPKLNELRRKFAPQGAEFIYFSLDEHKASWESTVSAINPIGVNISDLQGIYGKTALELGITATPYFFLLDGQQKLQLCTFGNEVDLLEKTLQVLLDK
jgi:hypothetical protein